MYPSENIRELLRGWDNKPSKTNVLELICASANKPSLVDAARVKHWLGCPLSLQEKLALLEVLIKDS